MRSDFQQNQRKVMGQRLRETREASNYNTPEAFGLAFGATPRQVLAWEDGKGDIPFSFGVAVAQVCRVSASWLCDYKEPKTADSL